MLIPPRIIWFDSLDSTSDEARRQIRGLDNMSVVAAVCQYSGRGQRGNRWISAPGENLTFSVVLKPSGPPLRGMLPSGQFAISEMAALAVRDYLVSRGVPAIVKWPNDVFVGDRKISGMLIENSVLPGSIEWSILGIGINLNQKDFPVMAAEAASLSMLTGKSYSPTEELDAFMGFLDRRLHCNDLDALHREYRSGLYRKGVFHNYYDTASKEVFSAAIHGVTPEGLLEAMLPGGEVKRFSFKEISYII